jgi:catechol 2,3-dioxygenase-like lactoylglutathione lyase family enzyme
MRQLKVECINPVLRVEDMQAALRFYVDVLGFQPADWGSDDFTSVGRDGGSLYLSLGDQGRGGAWVWIGVDDVEPLYEDLKARGVPILLPPTNFDWALEMRVADPDGNVLRFGSEPK